MNNVSESLEVSRQKLQAKIKEVGVTNAGKMVGRKTSDISRWMSGRGNWSLRKMIEVAKKLGI